MCHIRLNNDFLSCKQHHKLFFPIHFELKFNWYCDLLSFIKCCKNMITILLRRFQTAMKMHYLTIIHKKTMIMTFRLFKIYYLMTHPRMEVFLSCINKIKWNSNNITFINHWNNIKQICHHYQLKMNFKNKKILMSVIG